MSILRVVPTEAFAGYLFWYGDIQVPEDGQYVSIQESEWELRLVPGEEPELYRAGTRVPIVGDIPLRVTRGEEILLNEILMHLEGPSGFRREAEAPGWEGKMESVLPSGKTLILEVFPVEVGEY